MARGGSPAKRARTLASLSLTWKGRETREEAEQEDGRPETERGKELAVGFECSLYVVAFSSWEGWFMNSDAGLRTMPYWSKLTHVITTAKEART
jgi:hypothetical protein